MRKLELYRYKDLSAEAKEKALQDVLNQHIFDRDYILDKQIGDNAFSKREEYYRFQLELEDDNYWYKSNDKIAIKTNPLILDGDELSIENMADDEINYKEACVTYTDADSYAKNYGYTSWKALKKEFKKQKKLFGLREKIKVRRKDNGFTLTVCMNFTYKYWKKHA